MQTKIIKTVALIAAIYAIIIGMLWIPFNVAPNTASIWLISGWIMTLVISLPAFVFCVIGIIAVWLNND